MSKILMLVRHAKAASDDPSLEDHERPLTKRGRKAAKQAGRMLGEACLTPALMISSTAVRARKTAEKIAQGCEYPRAIELAPEIYLAPPTAYLAAAKEVAGDPASIMLIGHNPGISELLAQWSPETGEMPTTAIAIVELEIRTWSKLLASTAGKLILYWSPKEKAEN